ncbi:hypothetical protein AAVH_26435, partial [Aphelenchoides avenae]
DFTGSKAARPYGVKITGCASDATQGRFLNKNTLEELVVSHAKKNFLARYVVVEREPADQQ